MKKSHAELGPNYSADETFQLNSFSSTTRNMKVMEIFLGTEGKRTMLQLTMQRDELYDIKVTPTILYTIIVIVLIV